nr:hypothetical protein [Tanacetum cinerariifolium]
FSYSRRLNKRRSSMVFMLVLWKRLLAMLKKVKQEEKQYGFHVSPLEAIAGHVK